MSCVIVNVTEFLEMLPDWFRSGFVKGRMGLEMEEKGEMGI
jgi:hypothetical protein